MIQLSLLKKGPGNARLLEVKVGKKQLVTPTYFPAISRKEIRDAKDCFLELVTTSGYPRLLVSAYDYGKTGTKAQRRAVKRLSDYNRHGSIVMLDSGVFESYWREDPRWAFTNYRNSVMKIDSDFFMSFDVLALNKVTYEEFRKLTLQSILDSSRATKRSHCIPIVHERNPSNLVHFVSDLLGRIPELFASLAVSERELGQTISERCIPIMKLRRSLNKHGGGLLHVLGCGQPISMAFYVYSGADTFDSLDWALSAFDPQRERLIDRSHFELLGCKCEVCKKSKIDPSSRVYLHNLLSYQKYSMKLHSMVNQGTLFDYLQELTSKPFLNKLA